MLHPRLWGGDRLRELPGAGGEDAAGEPIGEAWLLGPDARVSEGPHRGARLGDLAHQYGAPLLGRAAMARHGPVVPLLAKLLDARAQLSIQVHPDDARARERHAGSGHLGKTESWLVLEADPGATVQWGFVRPVSREEVRAALDDGTLPDLVRDVPVAAGDVIHNPAGTVHALGGGLLVYELQQASDLTYRLYDFGRVGADGKPRELHVDDALAVADRSGEGEPHPPARPRQDGWTTLVACPAYRLELTEIVGARELPGDPDSLQALTVLSGQVALSGAGQRHLLARGGSAVIPAALPAYRLEGEATVVRGRVAAPEEAP